LNTHTFKEIQNISALPIQINHGRGKTFNHLIQIPYHYAITCAFKVNYCPEVFEISAFDKRQDQFVFISFKYNK